MEGQINEINLPGLSSYIKSALGYEIESGQLDLGIDVNFSGTEMDGKSHVLLRGIKLTAFDNYEDGSLSDQTSIPFNAALSMLKDSDGNVDLDLPLSGDINGPSFGLSGFLNQVRFLTRLCNAKFVKISFKIGSSSSLLKSPKITNFSYTFV